MDPRHISLPRRTQTECGRDNIERDILSKRNTAKLFNEVIQNCNLVTWRFSQQWFPFHDLHFDLILFKSQAFPLRGFSWASTNSQVNDLKWLHLQSPNLHFEWRHNSVLLFNDELHFRKSQSFSGSLLLFLSRLLFNRSRPKINGFSFLCLLLYKNWQHDLEIWIDKRSLDLI